MTAEELTLNIATNLGRISRWAAENRPARVRQFLNETEHYVAVLERAAKSEQFEKTFQNFREAFEALKREQMNGDAWAEQALTWASILTHRAKLA